MSRIFLAFLICAALTFDLTHAQENASAAPAPADPSQPAVTTSVAPMPVAPRKPKAAPKPVATPMPIATPIPRKLSFWERLFGRRRTPRTAPRGGSRPLAATPIPKKPAPPATPKPAVRKPASPKPAPERPAMPSPEKPEVEKPAPPVEKPESKATPEPKPKATPEPKATPQPKSKATPTPKVKKDAPPTVKSAPVPEPPAGSDPEKVERWKFSEAKRKAMEDSEVAGLKNKADTAPEGDEARKAMRAYNKALFDKMRKLDPALKDRIDGTEAAVMKRLGE